MARKQEQEPARDEISEVAPNVLRMELDVRIPGLGHVNCYALLDDEGAAVVDPGMPGSATHSALIHRLAQAGLKVKDVHTVLVTHSHPDHFGGAARIAEESGARIVAHRNFSFGPAPDRLHDEPEVSVDDLAEQRESAPDPQQASEGSASSEHAKAAVRDYEPPHRGHRAHGTPWGGATARPPLRLRLKWQAMRWLGKTSWVPTISDYVAAGDVLRLAGRDWFVHHTPGHTEDHFCLHDPEEGCFLAGDHVLPTITPHISGLSPRSDPLNAFFDSLDQVAAIPDVRLALPAHGHPFSDLAGRAQAIREHHHERLELIRRICRELGPATVSEVSRKLFRPASWGAMAESETYAHLEHLRLAGSAECREGRRGQLIYEAG